MKSLELQDRGGKGWANTADAAPRHSGFAPSHYVSRPSGECRISHVTLRPTFTCRTLKPPHMRGHRQWLKLEGR